MIEVEKTTKYIINPNKMNKEQLMHLFSSLDVPPDIGKKKDEKTDAVIDIQLQRAIELLQGYDIFKTLEQNINLAKKRSNASPEAAESLADAAPEETNMPEPEGIPNAR